MAPPTRLPERDEMKRLKDNKVPYEVIADEYGVTVNAVYLRMKKMGLTEDRPTRKDLIPWTVAREHQSEHPFVCLRVYGQMLDNIEDGKEPDDGIPRGKFLSMQKWLKEMGPRSKAGYVLDYDRDCPPNPASPKRGGVYYRRWETKDGDSLIRQPKMQRNARLGTSTALRG